ncbi:glycosyltransferase [candidate division KSB1 bacterium]|nr:glycosyltransferase [candidate division KSB1 bacterium]
MILLSFIVLLYIICSFVVYFGNKRSINPENSWRPSVSIIICARDEEAVIGDCLEALAGQDYPIGELEIIIVDDGSRDHTPEIARSHQKKSHNIKVVSTKGFRSKLKGKFRALELGLAQCSGKIILQTDADCRPGPSWVQGMVGHFTEEIGMVGGFIVLEDPRIPSLWTKVQALDWIYLLSVGAGTAGWGHPLSLIAKNMAFRREVYETIGGYGNIGINLTEDIALVKAISSLTSWKIGFSHHPDTAILSQPPSSLREYFQQRKRWTVGGRWVDIKGILIMLIAFLSHILVPISFFFNFLLGFILLAILLFADSLILWPNLRKINRTDLFRFFPFFEIYYFFYTIFFGFVFLLSRKIFWKGREYPVSK